MRPSYPLVPAATPPQFAVDSIRMWWLKAGSSHYSNADRLLILSGCGGSNGDRTRLWKHQLQVAFCNRFSPEVKVCHYSPGSSKWNPIEHRLFSFSSCNWAGQPLLDYETVLKFIRSTKTSAGLRLWLVVNTVTTQRIFRLYYHLHKKIGQLAIIQQIQCMA